MSPLLIMTTVTDENFAQEVLDSSAPVIVHFQAPWCGVCRLITPVLHTFQSDWLGAIRVLEVNADENFKLANHYQLRTLPTLLYIHQGQVLHRIEGFSSREGLRSRLDDIANRYRLEKTYSQSA